MFMFMHNVWVFFWKSSPFESNYEIESTIENLVLTAWESEFQAAYASENTIYAAKT